MTHRKLEQSAKVVTAVFDEDIHVSQIGDMRGIALSVRVGALALEPPAYP